MSKVLQADQSIFFTATTLFSYKQEIYCTSNITEQARKLFNHATKLTVDIRSQESEDDSIRSILEDGVCRQNGHSVLLRIYYRCVRKGKRNINCPVTSS